MNQHQLFVHIELWRMILMKCHDFWWLASGQKNADVDSPLLHRYQPSANQGFRDILTQSAKWLEINGWRAGLHSEVRSLVF